MPRSPPKRNLKTAALDEAKSFIGIFIYLFIVFGLLSLHAWVVLSGENISYRFYGMALINALVLSKIILLAEGFKFADKFKNQPLIYPVAYKAIAFTALAVCRLRRRRGSRRAVARQKPGRVLSGDRRRNDWRMACCGAHHVHRPHSLLRLQGDDEGDRQAAVLCPVLHRPAKGSSLTSRESPNRHSPGLFKTIGRSRGPAVHGQDECRLAGNDRRAILSWR